MSDLSFEFRGTAHFARVTIFEGQYWYLEHAYPSALKGWLVVVLKRHVEALHELTAEEFTELGAIQARATKLLFAVLDCEKEYVMCLAEGEASTTSTSISCPSRAICRTNSKRRASLRCSRSHRMKLCRRTKSAAFCELLHKRYATLNNRRGNGHGYADWRGQL